MNTIDRPIGWTTIDEAKRLVCASVAANTADMWYHKGEQNPKPYREHRDFVDSPCWSLGALFHLLPKEILPVNGSKSFLFATEGIDHPWTVVYVDLDDHDVPGLAFQKDTLVEACIEMIVALKVAEQEGKVLVLRPQDDEEGGQQ